MFRFLHTSTCPGPSIAHEEAGRGLCHVDNLKLVGHLVFRNI